MPKTTGSRRGSSPPRRRRPLLLALASLFAVAMVALVGVALGRSRPSGTAVEDPGPAHVHGLGVNPSDGALFAATHTGLFRIPERGPAKRIADRYQDTMAFTVVGPDRFLASGHPDLRDPALRRQGRPPLLGLIESTDAGQSWSPISLLGEADFHTLALSGGTLVGYDSTGGRVMATTDRRSWETRSLAQLGDLAVDPTNPERMVGLDEAGSVIGSVDGGRSWSPAPGPALMLVRWDEAGRLWGAAADGTIHRRGPDGAWEQRAALGGEPEALLVEGPVVHVAVAGRGIVRSDDEGRTWRLRYRAEP